ncbi:hypothetical protein [Flavobacterium sp. SM2513]|uniref:hypothetical protein n=1 Tax=Flavobacterium sp. SM2513 TaxID=3424766 RepID=UPI003D7FBBEF
MKKLVTLVLVVIATTFAGCSSDDGGGSTQDDLYIKFTYEGQQYNFEPATITSGQKLIDGMEDVNDIQTRLSLRMPENPTTGTFNITDETVTDTNLNTLHSGILYVGDATYDGVTGTMIITSVSEEYVIGTFSFSGEDENGVTVAVTNGSFKAFN